MSVKNQHADYARMESVWKRCEDVACGQDAVHAAGEVYLPKLKDQTPEDYKAYLLRATFYNAGWRTIAGLIGMLFRKPPVVEVPAGIEDYLDDVTMSGIPLHVFVQEIAEECLIAGRCGLLVDYPQANVTGATVADAQSLGLRPTMQLYEALSIINWRVTRVNNQSVLSLVVLTESAVTLKDEFTEEAEIHYRVLDLFNGQYRQRVFRVEHDKDILLEEFTPLMNGKPLDYIPFVFFGSDDLTPEVDEPPLIDLINTNLAHYRTTADYEHGCHFTGLPTAVVSGYTPITDGEKLYIGSQAAWVFPDPGAKASFLEFTGQGLQSLEKNLESKEQQMAVLGARMLEALKRGVESAQTASIHRVGEESVLAAIAQVISMGVTKALGWFAEWANADGEVKFELNRDFYPAPMDYNMLTSLIAGWQQGAYSYDTLFDNLKAGEVVGVDATAEEEQAKIANAPPLLNSPALAPTGLPAGTSATA